MKTFVSLILLALLVACAKQEEPSDPPPSIEGTWTVQEFRHPDGTVTTSGDWLTIEGTKWSFGRLGGPKEEGTITRQGSALTVATPAQTRTLDIAELTNERMVLKSPDGKFTATYKRLGPTFTRFRVQQPVPNPQPLFSPPPR